MKSRALVLVSLVLASACTSSRPDEIATATPPTSVSSTDEMSTPGAPDRPDDAAAPSSDAEDVSVSDEPGDGAGSSTTEPATAIATPALFPDDEDTVGLTDTTIHTCGHAQLYLGRAFDVEPEDSQVYWMWVNDHGGIHGRRVEEDLVEDGGGRLVAQAYEECRGAFVLRGGPTMDAVPAMREIVEADPHRPLYLHFMARADESKRYSFSTYPSQEDMGVLAARHVLDRHPGRRIGIIHRDSDGWAPGHDTFVETLRAAGVEVVADIAQASNDSVFAGALARLHDAGAEVVWSWTDTLATAQMIKEAAAQRYGFRWVVGFPANLLTNVLGDDALEPEAITGVSTFPAYTPGLPVDSFVDEVERFEAAFRKYRGRSVPAKAADVLFFKWLEDRNLGALFELCGRDCGRNRLVEVIISGRWRAVAAACPFDFRAGHAGGRAANVLEAFRSPAGVTWREAQHCVAVR